MPVTNPNTGAISDGPQQFKGKKTVEGLSTVSVSGLAGTTELSSGTGTIKMSSASNANSAAWIPIEYEGVVYYVPAFAAHDPA